mgnify:CR=1 FL=1
MDKKVEFKNFVKQNPRLIKFVKNGEMTWQKFYEIYDMYGTESSVWDSYLKDVAVGAAAATAASSLSFNDVINWVKGIDLDSVQSGINNIQRVVGMVQDFSKKDTKSTKEEYKPRPVYKHFED